MLDHHQYVAADSIRTLHAERWQCKEINRVLLAETHSCQINRSRQDVNIH
jgi:hypothetical protein